MFMEEEFNAEAAGEFQEAPVEEPRQDLKMVIEALLADTTSLEMLAQALAPLLGLTGTESSAAPLDEEVIEEEV
jgi:hypothetical protein